MNKIFTLLLLACVLVSKHLAFAETGGEDSEENESTSEAKRSSVEYTVMGNPLADRKFFITINSVNSMVSSGTNAFSALGWFFGKRRIIGLRAFPGISETMFNLKVIEVKLNQNYENAVNYKNSVTRKVPEAETAILISKSGFYCDKQFCEQAGEEEYGMGICTPYYCDCNREVPEAKRCNNLYEAFDPVYKTCAEAYKVKICGFYG